MYILQAVKKCGEQVIIKVPLVLLLGRITGELATACYGQVQFLDGVSGNLIQKLEWKGSLVSIALSSDSDVVACGSQDNSVHFWRRSSGNDSKNVGLSF